MIDWLLKCPFKFGPIIILVILLRRLFIWPQSQFYTNIYHIDYDLQILWGMYSILRYIYSMLFVILFNMHSKSILNYAHWLKVNFMIRSLVRPFYRKTTTTTAKKPPQNKQTQFRFLYEYNWALGYVLWRKIFFFWTNLFVL